MIYAPILLVDDDAHVRTVMRRVLSRMGHDVLEADNGLDVLGLAQRVQPALIIIDLTLCGRSGFMVIQDLQNDPLCAAIPILALSAYAIRPVITAAWDAGCQLVLAKPFGILALETAVTSLLGQVSPAEDALLML